MIRRGGRQLGQFVQTTSMAVQPELKLETHLVRVSFFFYNLNSRFVEECEIAGIVTFDEPEEINGRDGPEQTIEDG